MKLEKMLTDPEVFYENRLPAHSDHLYLLMEKDEDPVLSLDGCWKYHYSRNLEERPRGFEKPRYDLSGFDEIRVPGHPELQGFGKPQYINTLYPWDGIEELRPPQIPEENPVGSYVRFFDLDGLPDKGEDITLLFHGVETAFSVWLNGHYVGYSEDSFTPAEFCVTDFVKEKDNRLAVEVYRRSSASGIFRSVELRRIPKAHVRDLTVTADYDEKTGEGLLRVIARLICADNVKSLPVLHLSLTGGKGEELPQNVRGKSHRPKPPEENEEKKTEKSRPGVYTKHAREVAYTWEVKLPGVRPWSAEEPTLYQLEFSISEKDKLIELVRENAGFRTFRMQDGVMCLNGERIIFRGVNRHEFSLSGGRCITEEEMRQDIRILKENNINAVRTCHYPNQTMWYRLCDEYGIYLIDETNLETHGSWQKLGRVEPSWNIPGDLPQWQEAVLDRARSMYERDKNHPSVLIWSLGNESFAGEDFAAMSDYFHTVDPRRLVHYEGVFHRQEYRYISDMESRMYAKPAEIRAYLEEELRKKEDPAYTTKPYISCEYMHAMGNSLGGMQFYTELEDLYEGYQGGFIWDYIDQVLPKQEEGGTLTLAVGGDFDDRPTDYGFCTNGIVYGDRTLSPKIQDVRALYSPIRIRVTEDAVTVENRNLFVDTEGILFTVSAYRDGELLEKKALTLSVKPGCFLTVPHEIVLPEEDGLYTITVRAFREEISSDQSEEEEADAWIECSFGQYVEEKGSRVPVSPALPGRIVTGDGHLGIIGDDFRVQFSMTEASLSSYVWKDREMIDRIPKISFWRAMTDNDRGAGYPALMAPWYAAGHFAKKDYEAFRMEPVEGGVRMVTSFRSGLHEEVRFTVAYTAYADGRILVTAELPGVKGYPPLPVFAMDMAVKKEMNQVTFLGLGPEENYCDRQCGAELGRFDYTVEENLSGYLMPQECGNRGGVREFTVTDPEGRGLRFTAEGEPLNFSVLPCSAYELEEASRREELPAYRHTWIRIAACEMGVGGDDSWGAPVHEEYLLDPAVPRKLSFWISPC